LGRTRKLSVVGLAGVVRDRSALEKIFQVSRALCELTTPELARRRAEFWLAELAFRVGTNMRAQTVQSGLAKSAPRG
jgi:hypothetical protein